MEKHASSEAYFQCSMIRYQRWYNDSKYAPTKSIGRHYFLIYPCHLRYRLKKDVHLIHALFCLYYLHIIVGFSLLLSEYLHFIEINLLKTNSLVILTSQILPVNSLKSSHKICRQWVNVNRYQCNSKIIHVKSEDIPLWYMLKHESMIYLLTVSW